jgi:nucleotide-binding universal stress UspA family protein
MMIAAVPADSPRSLLPWRRTNARAALPSAGVLLASTGKPFSDVAINRAAELARSTGGSRVRVITIARIHGSSFGLQHPGLMPNKKEKDAAQALVTQAIKALQKAGAKADGEVVITRAPGRSFARAARAAGVARVLIDATGRGRLDRLEARTAARYLHFRLKNVDLALV